MNPEPSKPGWLASMSSRLGAVVRRHLAIFDRRAIDADLDEEIRAHIEMATEEYLKQGMTSEEATRAARRDFGGVDQVKERHREARGFRWLEDLAGDVRVTARGLLKRPGFSLVVILTLALGIGANGTLFTVVDGLLLEPLPYPEPGELVVVWEDRTDTGGTARDEPTIADVLHWAEEAETLEALAFAWPAFPRLSRGDGAERLAGAQLSAGMLDVLGVSPAIGRAFLPSEAAPGGPPVALLSHGMWVSRFGADPAVVGRTLVLDESEHVVLGVMPESFRFPHLPNYSETPDVLTPFQRDPAFCQGVNECYRVSAVGRLADGRARNDATSELAALAGSGRDLVPGRRSPPVVSTVSLRDQTVGSFRPFALALFGMVSVLLAVACANVTSLLLARGEARHSELATRGALGASRFRMLRHLLAESTALGLLGGLLGLCVAALGAPVLVRLLSSVVVVPRQADLGFDARVVAFGVLISLAVGLGTGVAAGVRTLKGVGSDRDTLRARGTGTPRPSRLLRGLAVAQVSSAFVLVVGAALLYQGAQSLLERDRGFRSDDLLTVQLPLTTPEYEGRAANLAFVDRVADLVRGMPGVEAVAAASSTPLDGDGGGQVSYEVIDQANPEPENQTARFRGVSPEYFATMGIDVVRGRGISTADLGDTPRVLVVNEAMARRNWPDADPIGRRLAIGPYEFEVIGVVSDVLSIGLDEAESPVLYRPLTQGASDYTTLVVRRPGPEAVAPLIREEIRRLAPQLSGVSIRTMRDAVDAAVFPQRVTVGLTAALAVLALTLAMLGVYGLMRYQIARRTAEIGVRMALGSTAARTRADALVHGIRIVAMGVVIGSGVALAGAGFLSTLLYGSDPRDPQVFLVAAGCVCLVGILAVYLPAHRASGMSPVAALRSDN